MDILNYQGKRVVVSGCFSGMGEATVRMLLELGADVNGLDFKEPRLGLALFNQVDLRNPAAAVDGGFMGALVTGQVDMSAMMARQK